MALVCVSVQFRDAKGQVRKFKVCIGTGEDATAFETDYPVRLEAIIAAMQNMSNAHVQSEANWLAGGTAQSGFTYGSTGQFQSVNDVARLYYTTAAPAGDQEGLATVSIAAPKAAIFEADLITVNPTQTQVVALNTALVVGNDGSAAAVAASGSGLFLASFIGGIRLPRKPIRRWTKFTKDPTLSIAGI